MKKVVIMVLVLVSQLVISPIAISAEKAFTGTVHLRDGRTIEALNIKISSFSDVEKTRLTINDQRYELEPEKISSLDFIELPKKNNWIRDGSVIIVKLKNGKSATATYAGFKGYAYVSFLDDLTGERLTQGFNIDGSKDDDDPADIIRIDFSSAGNMKYSKSSNTYFPPSFSFDPYTGESLSAVVVNTSSTEANRSTFISHSSSSNRNAQARREDALTKKALDYAKTMVNPIASKEQVEKAFSEFRAAAEQTFK